MSLFQQLRKVITGEHASPTLLQPTIDALLQLELARELKQLQNETRSVMPENPATRGFKVYSQADEDGILEEICRRLQLEGGSFIEIGCGDGRENNTHYLLLKGWSGVWVDGDSAHIASIRSELPKVERLHVIEKVVTRDNVETITDATSVQSPRELDLLSVDVDGNDLAITSVAVSAWKPKIVVCEYNAKFPYPLMAEVTYDAGHQWKHDDYHGASLAAFVRALESRYRLVSCTLAGTNAFFVREDVASAFEPYTPEQLFQPARFHLTLLRSGHPPSLSFLKAALAASGT